MRTVDFRLENQQLKAGSRLTLNPYVDGVHLRELARVVERPYTNAQLHGDTPGNYAGLADLAAVCWPSRHLLDEPGIRLGHHTVLLGCACGEVDCWPLAARVEVTHKVVIWSRFLNGRRAWDLSALGRFVFERDQYEEALALAVPPPGE